jgi:hypothetical protein
MFRRVDAPEPLPASGSPDGEVFVDLTDRDELAEVLDADEIR